jgi:hypothetical protein
MKPATTAKLSTIAKMVAKEHPEVFQQMCAKSEPMLRNVNLIPRIFQKIEEQFPEMDRTDKSIMFAACVYSAYAPATLESPDLERSPNGIRQEMCKVMEWKDAPICNYYKNISAAYFKGKTFREKVNNVLDQFQGHSVKSNQASLF